MLVCPECSSSEMQKGFARPIEDDPEDPFYRDHFECDLCENLIYPGDICAADGEDIKYIWKKF